MNPVRSTTINTARTEAASRPAKPTRTKRRERGSINVDDILDGAFEVAEQVSLAKLTMPLLAKHLDVGVTSIYWYFWKKEDLLAAMTDRAMEHYIESNPFDRQGVWDVALRNHTRASLQMFREQPVLADLLLLRSSLGLNSLRSSLDDEVLGLACDVIESVLVKLRGAGFTPDDAMDVYSAVTLHTRGIVMQERIAGDQLLDETMIDSTRVPLTAALLAKGRFVSVPDDRMFELGLDAIFAQAKRKLKASETRTKRRPAASSGRAGSVETAEPEANAVEIASNGRTSTTSGSPIRATRTRGRNRASS